MKKWVHISYFWGPPVFWAILIFALSSRSLSTPPSFWFPGLDKCVHVILFALLAFLFYRAFQKERQFSPARSAAFAFLLAFSYGALDEMHQYFVPYRSPELLDWAADIAGALLGVAPFLWTRFKSLTPARRGRKSSHE